MVIKCIATIATLVLLALWLIIGVWIFPFTKTKSVQQLFKEDMESLWGNNGFWGNKEKE